MNMTVCFSKFYILNDEKIAVTSVLHFGQYILTHAASCN